jgi:hypothetical protein
MLIFATQNAIIHFHLMPDEMITTLGALHGLTGTRQQVLDALRLNVLHKSTYDQLTSIFSIYQTMALEYSTPEAVEFDGTA